MLTAKIYNDYYGTESSSVLPVLPYDKSYTEELIEFSWSMTNNEGTSFSASVPTLNASLVITAVDDFLKAVNRYSYIEVTSDVDDGLVLKLNVIECTPLERKGKTEISCTGNFFTQTNNIWGTLKIDANSDWAVTRQDYGLDNVEYHGSNPQFNVNVSKKEDIALGLAWSFPDRKNLSLTPFTTADTNFKGQGIGIFNNVKGEEAEDETADTYAPVYQIKSDQIIDYDIQPAQPPVTHLITATLGKLQPLPIIPAIEMLKYSSANVATRVSAFQIQAFDFSAVQVTQEDTSGNATSSALYWSDGIVTNLDSPTYKVVAVFSDVYVVYAQNQLGAFNRSTGEQVQWNVSGTLHYAIDVTDADAQVILNEASQTRLRPATTTIFQGMQVAWMKRAISPGLAIVRNVSSTGVVTLSFLTVSNASAVVGADCIAVEYVDNPISEILVTKRYGTVSTVSVPVEEQDCVALYSLPGSALFAIRLYFYYDNPVTGPKIVSKLSLQIISLPIFSSTDIVLDFSATLSKKTVTGYAHNEEVTLSSTVLVLQGTTLYAYTLQSNNTWASFYATFTNVLTAGWSTTYANVGTFSTKIATQRQLLIVYASKKWELYNSATVSATVIASPVQSGSVSQWIEYADFEFAFFRNILLGLEKFATNAYRVYLQLSELPFATRGSGDVVLSNQISQGNYNPVTLAFKVGAVAQSDFDVDRGRVELSVSEFYVRNNTNKQWVLKDAQALNLPAVTSYCKVYLTPEDEAQGKKTLIKILAVRIRYTGKVELSITGMIVE